jgi:hypothetical protein
MAARLSALRAGRTSPPGFFSYTFLLEAESTPGAVRSERLGQLKNPPHRDLNPRPSGLQHSALTTTLPRAPHRITNTVLNKQFMGMTDWCCLVIVSVRGRAIAQAVSRRLPTAAAWVHTRVWLCGILWWTKVALGKVFSENFGFLCQSTFHLLLHNHLHYHPRLA